MMTAPKGGPVVAAVMLLVLAACAGNGDGVPNPTPTEPPTSSTTSTTVSDTTVTTEASTTTSTTFPEPEPSFDALRGINTVLDFADGYTSHGLRLWERSVPGVVDTTVRSTIDGDEQPVLWVPPSGDWPRPLLVALHSWSTGYQQHASIPFAMWAEDNGWAFIAPNFRGANNRREAMGSDLAVQDVIDAIDFAISEGGVNPDRVYVVGFSGGGMMSLLLAGRHPDRIAGAASWTPVYDLIEFYTHSRANGQDYTNHVRTVCGGDPTRNDAARDECLHRSPMTHLEGGTEVPVYIGQGLTDSLVPPSQAARAYNKMAAESDQLTEDELNALRRNRLPSSMSGSIGAEHYFGSGDPSVVFARESGTKVFVLFQGGHEMAYRPALHWFASDPGRDK